LFVAVFLDNASVINDTNRDCEMLQESSSEEVKNQLENIELEINGKDRNAVILNSTSRDEK
jgi:hypothetical protein